MHELRARERVPMGLSGRGSVTNRETSHFELEVLDFSILGMQIQVEGDLLRIDDRVRLELDLSAALPDHEGVTIFGQIVRCEPGDGEQFCGVRVEVQDATRELEALDEFYIQRYFDLKDDELAEE